MRIILLLSVLDGHLHIAVGSGKIVGTSLKLGTVHITVGSVGELMDKVLDQGCISGRILLCLGHVECQNSLLDVIGQLLLNLGLLQTCLVHTKARNLQRIGKAGAYGIVESILIGSGLLHHTDYFAHLVNQRTANGVGGHGECYGIVIVLALEGLSLTNGTCWHVLYLVIRQQPSLTAYSGRSAADGQRLGFTAYTELYYIVHIVYTYDAYYGHFFTGSINHYSSCGTLEWGVVTDCVAIGAGKETVTAADERTVSGKGFQGEYRLGGFLYPARLSTCQQWHHRQ